MSAPYIGELWDGEGTARVLTELAALRQAGEDCEIELTDGIWDLRDALTAYDAAYLALALRLDVGLVTLDGSLARMAAKEGRLAERL